MPPATMPQLPVAMSVTPEMANLEGQLQGIANVSPAAINMAAKQYFAPIVNPLVREGGQRLQEYVGGLQGMLNVPTGETQASYTTGINNAIQNMARTAGQYDANLGLRDYYGTRAETLGNLGLQTLQYQQQAKKNLYDQIANRLAITNQNRWQNYLAGFDQRKYLADQAQNEWEKMWKQKEFDESVRQFNAIPRGGGGDTYVPRGGDIVTDLENEINAEEGRNTVQQYDFNKFKNIYQGQAQPNIVDFINAANQGFIK